MGEQDFRAELRIAPEPVIAAIGVIAFIVALFTEELATPVLVGRARNLRLVLYAVPLLAWALKLSWVWASKAFILFSLSGLVLLSAVWMPLPGTLTLLALLPGLAAAFFGWTAAPVVAGLNTLAVAWLASTRPEVPWTEAELAIGVLWLAVGVMWALYRPVYRVTTWTWDYYRRAESLLEESRDRKVQLEAALEDLEQANRQLMLSNQRAASLRTVAEEAQRAKTSFVSKVSHEFRTPLNMIIGLMDLLLETPEVYGERIPPALMEDLRIVHRNSDHLSSLVDDILALSQVESGRLTLHREEVDLREVVEGAVAVVQPLVRKKGLTLDVDVPDELPHVYCDRTRIRQVILNLVSNAARFTDQGRISVNLQQQPGTVVVSVSDTGPGILPEDVDRIFEPFCQGTDRLWRDKGGTGLGLAISKQFVELHGGHIWLESDVGVGTTFYFRLPLLAPVPPLERPIRWLQEEWEWHERRPRATVGTDVGKPRIIVYDEIGDIHTAFTRYTDKVEFVRMRHLDRVAEEFDRYPANSVIVNTPTVDASLAALSQVRKGLPDVPILVTAVPPHLDTVLQAGADGYLIKPVRRADLARVLAALETQVRRVLVVDDQDDVRRLMTRILLAYDAGIQVDTAASGAEALRLLHSGAYDLMLLDVIMPESDGWSVLERKRQDAAISEVPVVLISAQDPRTQPVTSPVLMITMNQGLSLDQLVRCSTALTTLLLPEA
jgi:signal transduction histidine kinase/CheY-like chemotaxis protein